jgi:GTPase Era involved in 16S rRNA processing/uncharacterized protein (DUF697 family)
MGGKPSTPVESAPNFEHVRNVPINSNNNAKIIELEMLIQNIQLVVNDMKKEVKSNRLMPNTFFNPLFATLDDLQKTMDPHRSHVCYCIGGTNSGKSSITNGICKENKCRVSDDETAGTTDFQIVSVPEVNAIFVDTTGFGSDTNDNPLVKKFKTQMKTVYYPDAVILVVTREQLRDKVCLKHIMDNVNNVLKWVKRQRCGIEIPVICVLNKIDQYFDNNSPRSEADMEKVKVHTEKALRIVNEYLIIPATQCIPVSATKNYGIDQLRLNINAQSPLNAQIIDKNLDYVSQYRLSIANKIIAAFSIASAAVSFLPIVDIVTVTFLQEWMYRMLACFSVDPSRTADSFKTVHRVQQGASVAIRTGALFVGGVLQLSLVGYFIGSGICVAAAATSTAAIGWTCYFYFVE